MVVELVAAITFSSCSYGAPLECSPRGLANFVDLSIWSVLLFWNKYCQNSSVSWVGVCSICHVMAIALYHTEAYLRGVVYELGYP